MTKLSNIFRKKPTENKLGYQLFAFDVNGEGAKSFVFSRYDDIYDIIKKYSNPHFYEETTFAKSIKLYIDIDEDKLFENKLERDKYANFVLNSVLSKMSIKIYQAFKIKDTPAIILISDTLKKVSLHIIYPNIIFSNLNDMKHFMHNVDIMDKVNYIDGAVYRIGCFRMLYCSKYGKENKLIYYDSRYYNKPQDDYLLFLDTCICYTNNKKPLEYKIENEIPKKKTKNEIKQSMLREKNVLEKKYKYTYLLFLFYFIFIIFIFGKFRHIGRK